MFKVLLADDEDAIRMGLKTIISRMGFEFSEIVEASNGREAIHILESFEADIIITDIRMPHVDGLELIEWVTANKKVMPAFIILSGYDDFSYAKKAIQYGVKEYLLKPVSKEEIARVLGNITQQLLGEKQRNEAALLRNIQSREGLELLKEKHLNALIRLRLPDQDEETALKQLSRLGVDFKYHLFRVLVIENAD